MSALEHMNPSRFSEAIIKAVIAAGRQHFIIDIPVHKLAFKMIDRTVNALIHFA